MPISGSLALGEWRLDRLPEEVRREAEEAAQRAGLPLHRWLGRVIRDVSASEGIAVSREVSRANFDGEGGQTPARPLDRPPKGGDSFRTLAPLDLAEPPLRNLRPLYPADAAPSYRPLSSPPVNGQHPTNGVRPLSSVATSSSPVPPAQTKSLSELQALWPKMQPPPPPPPPARHDERQAALTRLMQALQRNDLSPIGEARLYLKLLTEHMAAISDITVATGRTRDQVARTLRLLGLSDRLRDMIDKGALTRDQAFALLDAADPEAFAQVILPAAVGRRAP